MKQQKLMLLTLFLYAGLLMVSSGITFARYRHEHREGVAFQVREPGNILIGTMKDGIFTSADQLEWIVKGDVASLQFAVANGTSEDDFYAGDQAIRLRMIGSLGILKDGEPSDLSVTFVPQRGNEEQKTINAIVSPIMEGTALYHSYGAGWLYTFYESTAEGIRELTWELSGDNWSCITLTVKIQGKLPEGLSLLQPLVSAEPIDN